MVQWAPIGPCMSGQEAHLNTTLKTRKCLFWNKQSLYEVLSILFNTHQRLPNRLMLEMSKEY